MTMLRGLLASILLMTASVAHATSDDLRSVAGMQFHNRVLLVFAPSLHDARLAAQGAVMAQLAIEAAKRDLLFVQVDPMTVIGAHDNGDKLRRKFRVPVDAYRALLIGKDGKVALESNTVIEGPRILHAIDAMPMRQAEVRAARAGKPIAR
jgi:hypothetical protein